MPALPELLVFALALLALWAAQDRAVDAHGALAGGETPADDLFLLYPVI